MVSARQICELVDRIAPFETAEAYDNVGLLAGHPGLETDAVLVALDLMPGVIEEAKRLGARLILTHHPILFHARRNLREDDPEGALLCALVRSGCALVSAHTNFDKASGGVSDALARELGLSEVELCEGGLACVGAQGGSLEDFVNLVRERVNPNARVYGTADRIEKVGVSAGAGGEFWPLAKAMGARVFLTGEARHHEILAAVQSGLVLIDAGHYETERVSVKALVRGLQNAADALQYNVRVLESQFSPFG